MEDDNNPAPENIPTQGQQDNSGEGKATWGWSGVCQHKGNNHANTKPTIQGLNELTVASMTYAGMFMLLFPMMWVKEVMIPEMNKVIEGSEVTFGEFLCFLGLCFFMSTMSGFSKSEFFSCTEINFQK